MSRAPVRAGAGVCSDTPPFIRRENRPPV